MFAADELTYESDVPEQHFLFISAILECNLRSRAASSFGKHRISALLLINYCQEHELNFLRQTAHVSGPSCPLGSKKK